jgi:hypothetical protein
MVVNHAFKETYLSAPGPTRRRTVSQSTWSKRQQDHDGQQGNQHSLHVAFLFNPPRSDAFIMLDFKILEHTPNGGAFRMLPRPIASRLSRRMSAPPDVESETPRWPGRF